MPQPFFWIETVDIVWDADVNPEGFAQNLKFKPADGVGVFFNAGQFVLDEDNPDSNDQWLLGEQVGTELSLGSASRLTLAVADYYSTNINASTEGQTVVQFGNTRSTSLTAGPCPGVPVGALCGDFNVVDIDAQLATGWTAPVYRDGNLDPKHREDHQWKEFWFSSRRRVGQGLRSGYLGGGVPV